MFRYTNYVMYLAPLGVGAAIAVTVASKGAGVLFGLGKLILTMYAAQIIFVSRGAGLGSDAVPDSRKAAFYRRRPRAVSDCVFDGIERSGRCPRALENMEQFGVPKHIVAFGPPVGYSFNLDGSTLYLSLASVFVAQAAGVDLTLGQQLLMMLTLMLTSKGVAGVPRAALVILAGTLEPPAHGRRGRAFWELTQSWTWRGRPSTCWAIAWPRRWWRGGKAWSFGQRLRWAPEPGW